MVPAIWASAREAHLSLFISFGGGDGSGKSTQAEILARRLQQAGVPSLLVHEPGTTSLGWYLRDWLKQEKRREESVSHRAELLLFAAARAEFDAICGFLSLPLVGQP